MSLRFYPRGNSGSRVETTLAPNQPTDNARRALHGQGERRGQIRRHAARQIHSSMGSAGESPRKLR
jgi:hypothetical protein